MQVILLMRQISENIHMQRKSDITAVVDMAGGL
jgi:hypothetical protein